MNAQLREALDHLMGGVVSEPVRGRVAEPVIDGPVTTLWYEVDGLVLPLVGTEDEIKQALRRLNTKGAVIKAARPPRRDEGGPRGYAHASSHIRL